MKKQILLAAVAFFLSMGTLFAQAPNLFNYQGVARDASGQALSGQAISLRIIIRTGSSTGTLQYRETHNVTTNSYGLYNVAVGNGTDKTNTLAGVTWGNGEKYMQVQIDPNGGTSWTTVGTTQLLSAPYALFAKEVAPKEVIAFRARGVASGTIGTTSSVNPVFTTEVYDQGNGYNNTTGEFTAPEDGIYHFEATMQFDASAPYSSGYMTMGFETTNGSSFASIVNLKSDDNEEFSGHSSTTLKLSSGDKVQVRLFRSINGTITYATNLYYNEFSGYKIN